MPKTYQSTDQIPPGKYVRRRAGFEDTTVDIFYRGGILTERSPMGTFGEPRDNPGATYTSVEAMEFAMCGGNEFGVKPPSPQRQAEINRIHGEAKA